MKARAFLVVSCLLLVISHYGCGDVSSNSVASLSISPTSATVGINDDQLFSAVAHNNAGNIVSVTPTWSVSGGIGTISSTGLFFAGSQAGSGTITASAEGKTASAAVAVTTSGWITGTVYDSAGNLVESIKVYLASNTSIQDFSDSSGKYTLSSVPAGTYWVLTLATSVYYSASAEVTVASGETKTQNLTLQYFTDPVDITPPTL
ncbi:MAG: carboxypeptidase-like regulatory domain-containing protein [Candidatus Margulisbacteria bacterium]|nr:carboxypeptidase-like regulatory domain-containing protein [Candidatus Margulisiibacteriota bacterium]